MRGGDGLICLVEEFPGDEEKQRQWQQGAMGHCRR